MDRDDLIEEFLILEELNQTNSIDWDGMISKDTQIIDQKKVMNYRFQHYSMFPDLYPTSRQPEQIFMYLITSSEIQGSKKMTNLSDRIILAEISTNQVIPSSLKIIVKIIYGKFSCKMNINANLKISKMVDFFMINISNNIDVDIIIKNYILKIGNLDEFVIDNNLNIYNIIYIQNCVRQKQDIVLTLYDYDDYVLTYLDDYIIQSYEDQLIDDVKNLYVNQQAYPSVQIEHNFCVTINNIIDLPLTYLPQELQGLELQTLQFYITLELRQGEVLLCPAINTQPIYAIVNNDQLFELTWDDTLKADININNIPSDAMICCKLNVYQMKTVETKSYFEQYIYTGQIISYVMAWTNIPFTNYQKFVTCGLVYRNLNLNSHYNYYNTYNNVNNPTFTLRLMGDINHKIMYTSYNNTNFNKHQYPPTRKDLDKILEIYKYNTPLHRLNSDEQSLLWLYRYYLKENIPNILPLLILSVKWSKQNDVNELYQLLQDWPQIDIQSILHLLHFRISDNIIRNFAVDQLCHKHYQVFINYLPQIVQIIKFEQHDYSQVTVKILTKALDNILIGVKLFWLLKSELHEVEYSQRIKLCLAIYLDNCGDKIRNELFHTNIMMSQFTKIANHIAQNTSAQHDHILRNKLSELNFSKEFRLPNNPAFIVSLICIEQCKIMNSNTVPLWLVFQNSNGDTSRIIFKVGDDLRVDIFALQLLKIMDLRWKNYKPGIDLYLQTYETVTISHEVGIIEVVENSKTVANIQGDTSTLFKFTSAFNDNALSNWLKSKNEDEILYKSVVQNFIKSCAAYCIATYVLGIGDRHNDNIMCNENGLIFHIDFGYFLGQKTSILGINKETAPFVLTDDFINVMGGLQSKEFKQFINLCLTGYLALRQDFCLFTTLCTLLSQAGIEQLHGSTNLHYIQEKLVVDYSEEEAKSYFLSLIQQAMSSYTTKANFAMHMMANNMKGYYKSVVSSFM